MSNKKNYRRPGNQRTETGPRWENPNPGAGCNSTHVARSRRGWKRLAARALRRTGKLSSCHSRRSLRVLLEIKYDE
jgi:hypothetical protein